MSHLNGVVQLQNFISKGSNWDNLHLVAVLVNSIKKFSIVYLGPLKAWEQVTDDVFKQRQVVLQEFRHIYVSQGSQ